MPTIKIDDQEYDSDNLNPNAKGFLQMLVATDARIKEAERDLAMFRAARMTYGEALKREIAQSAAALSRKDEILKFS